MHRCAGDRPDRGDLVVCHRHVRRGHGDGEVELDEIQFMLLDFRNPALHELIAEKALALKKSGLFDGIMLDWWNEHSSTTGKWPDWNGTHLKLNEEKAAGNYKINFNASELTSGVYFYRIQAGDFVETKKMIYLK